MAGMSNIIVIVLVLGVGYWLYSTGQLDQIIGSVQGAIGGIGGGAPAGGGNTATDTSGNGGDAYAESDGNGSDLDVSGENAGAYSNGECVGNAEQCRKAMNLLDQIR